MYNLGLSIPSRALALMSGTAAIALASFTNPNYDVNKAQLDAVATLSAPGLRTQCDQYGFLTYCPNNWLTYTNTFSNAAWSKNSVSVVDTGVTPPANYATAGTITASAGSAYHYLNRVPGVPNAGNYIAVWVVQRNNNDWIFLTVNDAYIAYFNTATGAFGTTTGYTNPTAVPLGNGWYMVSLCHSASGSSNGIGIGIASGNGGASFTAAGTEKVNVAAVYCSAVTYETNPRPQDLVITTSAAHYGPRFENQTGTTVGNNLLTYSNDFTNAAWTKTGSSVSGTVFSEDSSTGYHALQRAATVTSKRGIFALRAAKNTRSQIALQLDRKSVV